MKYSQLVGAASTAVFPFAIAFPSRNDVSLNIRQDYQGSRTDGVKLNFGTVSIVGTRSCETWAGSASIVDVRIAIDWIKGQINPISGNRVAVHDVGMARINFCSDGSMEAGLVGEIANDLLQNCQNHETNRVGGTFYKDGFKLEIVSLGYQNTDPQPGLLRIQTPDGSSSIQGKRICETSGGSPTTEDVTGIVNNLFANGGDCGKPDGRQYCGRVTGNVGSAGIDSCGKGPWLPCHLAAAIANDIQQNCLKDGRVGGKFDVNDGVTIQVVNTGNAPNPKPSPDSTPMYGDPGDGSLGRN